MGVGIQMHNYIVNPKNIEKRSFEIITEALGEKLNDVDPIKSNVIKRVIHTTGNLDMWNKLYFSEDYFDFFKRKIQNKKIYTDVNMIKSGLSKNFVKILNIDCFISDEAISKKSKLTGISRAYLSMEKALEMEDGIFIVGNAPTALFKLLESKKKLFIIGVPVGFVGAAESKEALMKSQHSFITLPGNMGGSTIAVAIFNALIRSL